MEELHVSLSTPGEKKGQSASKILTLQKGFFGLPSDYKRTLINHYDIDMENKEKCMKECCRGLCIMICLQNWFIEENKSFF